MKVKKLSWLFCLMTSRENDLQVATPLTEPKLSKLGLGGAFPYNKLLIEACAKPEDMDFQPFRNVIRFIARFDQFALKSGAFCTPL